MVSHCMFLLLCQGPAVTFFDTLLYILRVDLDQRSLKLSLTVHKRRSVGTETAPFLVA